MVHQLIQNFQKLNCKISSGGFDIANLMDPTEVVYKIANKAKDLSNKVSLDDVIKIANITETFSPYPKKILADPIKIFGTWITLTNHKIKGIIKLSL